MYPRLFQVAVAATALFVTAGQSPAATGGATPGLSFEQIGGWQIPYKPIDIVQSVDGKFFFVLTENHRVLIYEPNGSLKGSIPVEEGVTAIDTDARGENIFLIDGKKNTFAALSVDFVVNIDLTGSPVRGDAKAPVAIAVFTDFE